MVNDSFAGGVPAGASNGLGNLADELAEAWDDEEGDEEEPDMNFQEAPKDAETTRDSGVDVSVSPVQQSSSNLSPPKLTKAHRRQGSEYDGSEYGSDSDLDATGIPPALLTRMDMIDSLARRGAENNGTERDGVVKRVIDGLRDLGAQSGVEGGATRFEFPPTQ